MDAKRDAFEHWYSDNGGSPRAVKRDNNGEYVLMGAHLSWQAWQAAWDACEANRTTLTPAQMAEGDYVSKVGS